MEQAPFELAGDDRGILCVHGFTGTPFEMRWLGERLRAAGPTVHGLALPGHATAIDDLDPVTWDEWAGAVVDAYDRLVARCRTVAVVGQSLGGLLALYLATRRQPAAIASLAAPLRLPGLSGVVARATTRWPLAGRVRRLPKLGGFDVRDERAKAENPAYRAIPVRPLGELLAFMQIVDDALPRVTAPLLVIHAEQDHTAPFDSAIRITRRVSSLDQRLVRLTGSYHLVSLDIEREQVADEVATFFGRRLGSPG